MDSATDISPLLSAEQKELRRVFDYLCNFLQKNALRKQMQPKLERRARVVSHRKNPDLLKMMHADTGLEMTEAEVDAEYEQLCRDIESLEVQVAEFDKVPDKKIRAEDLSEALRKLGRKCTKKEIEDMIWEVDENLDGCVDWPEFKLMFERNITDKTGLEPYQLFNVVQFMMYDKDNSGKVSIDETMTMLYQRYGKEHLETQMKLLFGDDLRTADGDGELTFAEYLKAVTVRVAGRAKRAGPPGLAAASTRSGAISPFSSRAGAARTRRK